jgi:DNA-binding NarL/FixJ family response regulator
MPTPPRPTPLRSLLHPENLFVLSLPNPAIGRADSLPPAERDVARAILDGRSNDEIARERRTSVKTVANQLSRLFERFDVHSRAELVRKLEGSPAGE